MTDTGTPRQYDDERTDEERGAWHTPSIPQLDEDTLLYVRESIAGVIHATPKTGHHLERAIDLIDEIIRLRREHPLLSPAEHAVLLATLDAARPATDPAGLDDVRREIYDTVLRGLRSEDDSVQLRAIIASVEAARARLSVADGSSR